jgi:hypothetical protein
LSLPEVEKIGLAKAPEETAEQPVEQTDETPETEAGQAGKRSVHRAAGTGEAASGGPSAPAVAARVEPPTRQPRRIHPVLVLGLLVAIAGMLLALNNQAQRAAQFESQVAFLSAELDQAHADLAGYERQMGGVREAVADLNHRMSSLTELVNQPPSAGAD